MSKDKLVGELNQLLSDFHVYYQNVRGFHWNIKGSNFFQLHEKYEELYTEALTHIDEIAERILTIGSEPLHTFQDYLDTSNLKVYKGVSKDSETVAGVKESLEGLVAQENKVKELAGEVNDHETEDMMIALINSHEKTHWMVRSWLGS